jgi:repressor of nif and glnA expression
MSFKNKNILFISVKTFDYEKFIVQKLEELGAKVTFFDERPRNTVLVKGLIRIKKDLYSRQIENYYNKILNKIKDFQFDYLFVIKGEVIPNFFLLNFNNKEVWMTLFLSASYL